MKHVLATGAALLLAAGIAYAGDECLEVGSPVGAFYVADVTGPAAGTKLCYRCKFKDRPVVSIFAREVNDQVAGLVQAGRQCGRPESGSEDGSLCRAADR